MPRKKRPLPCSCGCGEMTAGGKFIPGHDARLYSAILQHVGGDVIALRHFVETHSGRKVEVEID